MTTSVHAPAPSTGASPVRSSAGRRPLAAPAGLLAAAVALGVAELVTGVVGAACSPVIAVGDAVITLIPEPVKAFAIRTFGENDTIALVLGAVLITAVCALLVGLVGLRNRPLGAVGIAALGLVGALAGVIRPPAARWTPSRPSLCAAGPASRRRAG